MIKATLTFVIGLFGSVVIAIWLLDVIVTIDNAINLIDKYYH